MRKLLQNIGLLFCLSVSLSWPTWADPIDRIIADVEKRTGSRVINVKQVRSGDYQVRIINSQGVVRTLMVPGRDERKPEPKKQRKPPRAS